MLSDYFRPCEDFFPKVSLRCSLAVENEIVSIIPACDSIIPACDSNLDLSVLISPSGKTLNTCTRKHFVKQWGKFKLYCFVLTLLI